jgi:hypothetical protein
MLERTLVWLSLKERFEPCLRKSQEEFFFLVAEEAAGVSGVTYPWIGYVTVL